MNLIGGQFGEALVGAPILNEGWVSVTQTASGAFSGSVTLPFTVTDRRRVFVQADVWGTAADVQNGSSRTTLHAYSSLETYCMNNYNYGINDARRISLLTDSSNSMSFYNSGGLVTTTTLTFKVVEYDVTVDWEELVTFTASTGAETQTLTNTITDLSKVVAGTTYGGPRVMDGTLGFQTTHPTFYYYHGNGTGSDDQIAFCIQDANTVKRLAATVAFAAPVVVRQYSW